MNKMGCQTTIKLLDGRKQTNITLAQRLNMLLFVYINKLCTWFLVPGNLSVRYRALSPKTQHFLSWIKLNNFR